MIEIANLSKDCRASLDRLCKAATGVGLEDVTSSDLPNGNESFQEFLGAFEECLLKAEEFHLT